MNTLTSSRITQHAISFLQHKMKRLNTSPFTPKTRVLLEDFYAERIAYIKTRKS